jgi:hypothetical protein
MSLSSKNQICNLALSGLGNYATITDIDTPTTDHEKCFAKWYDICLEFTLKMVMPNFAIARAIVAKDVSTPAFGYAYNYAKPSLCLKVLGVGEIEEKANDYTVEGEYIQHDTDYDEGMPVRYIKKITDVSKFSTEYNMLLAQYLAAYTCAEITQDQKLAMALRSALPMEMSSASGLNAQENRPTRISNSRFKAARYTDFPTNSDKR